MPEDNDSDFRSIATSDLRPSSNNATPSRVDEPQAETRARAPSQFEIYKEVRSEITYEANLAVSRTGWLVTSQAFLFSSLATAAGNGRSSITESLLFPLVPAIGIALCIATMISVSAALRRASKLSKSIRENFSPIVIQYQIQEDTKTVERGNLFAKLMPLIFIMAWSIISFVPLIRYLNNFIH